MHSNTSVAGSKCLTVFIILVKDNVLMSVVGTLKVYFLAVTQIYPTFVFTLMPVGLWTVEV